MKKIPLYLAFLLQRKFGRQENVFKQKGISMIIGLAVSFIVLGITLSVLFLSEKYREQSQNINLSNQTFFTLEAAQEAAFFHHNARGQGLHFDGTIDEVPSSQSIDISSTNTAQWIVRGRTEDLGNADVLSGVLKEGQVIQIPFFWDDSSSIEAAPSNEVLTDKNFELTFGRYIFDEDGNQTSEELVDSLFDFGSSNNEVLINWSLSKKTGNPLFPLTTFIPRSNLGGFIQCDSVGITTGFFCESNLGESIRSNVSIPGYILPGRAPTTLDAFYADDDGDTAEFMLVFQPILSFTDSDEATKIKGLPWTLEITTSSGFPKHFYEMELRANIGNFTKTLVKTFLEKTSLQGLDSVIFD